MPGLVAQGLGRTCLLAGSALSALHLRLVGVRLGPLAVRIGADRGCPGPGVRRALAKLVEKPALFVDVLVSDPGDPCLDTVGVAFQAFVAPLLLFLLGIDAFVLVGRAPGLPGD